MRYAQKKDSKRLKSVAMLSLTEAEIEKSLEEVERELADIQDTISSIKDVHEETSAKAREEQVRPTTALSIYQKNIR